MDRRTFIGTLAGAFLATPLASEAQPAGRVPRIGYVSPGSPSFGAYASQRAFLDGLRDHGYVQGQDFILEIRSTEGRSERLFDATTELVRAPVDVLLIGVCGEPLNAARRATQTIPIVVAACNEDLVETGIVASLGRPGGNITGLSKLTPELAAKRLELLKQTFPTISRVAVLWNPAYSDFKADWREMRATAHALNITLHPVEFRRPDELEPAFAAITRERVDALITFSDQLTYVYAKRVAELAATTRLPALYAYREIPDAGGLMSYGPSINGMWRRAASYVVKILQGEKPADLAIEQPTKIELVVNLQAAKALGITIPQSLLLFADDVIR
jgi:ABC-type uncharacterized transport system substrate-binding protein